MVELQLAPNKGKKRHSTKILLAMRRLRQLTVLYVIFSVSSNELGLLTGADLRALGLSQIVS